MASIRRKGKGWEVRFYDPTGRRHSRIVGGTLREAKARAAIWEGLPSGDSSPTFAAVAELWLASGGRRSSPLSQEGAERRLRRHVLPTLGDTPVADITPQRIETLLHTLRDLKGLAPSTLRVIRSDISGTLRRAVRDGLIDRNPAQSVEMPHQIRPERHLPPLEAVEGLLALMDAEKSLKAAETALAVRLALSTGARLGEVAGLRWGDVDSVFGTVSILRAVIKPKGGPLMVTATKGRTRRRVAVPEAVIDRLVAHHERIAAVRLPSELRVPSGDGDYILRGRPIGMPIDPDCLRARFILYRRRVGLDKLRFHDLRHLAASMFLADMPVLAASAAVGHRRTSTTTDTYGHLLDQAVDRRTAEAVSKRIRL